MSRWTAVSGELPGGRARRDSSAPLTVEADQTQRAPRSRAPLKKYGARAPASGEIWSPIGPVRIRPGQESAVCAETSSHATPPGGGMSGLGSDSDIRRHPSTGTAPGSVVAGSQKNNRPHREVLEL